MARLIPRKEIMLYLDTTPSEVSKSYALYGKKENSNT